MPVLTVKECNNLCLPVPYVGHLSPGSDGVYEQDGFGIVLHWRVSFESLGPYGVHLVLPESWHGVHQDLQQ